MQRLILAGAILMFATVADAKVEREIEHTFEIVWSTAVRHLRVNEGFEIVDKDSDAGYIIFRVKERDKAFRGSLEVVRKKRKGKRDRLLLVVAIADRPVYSEQGILDRLLSKIHGQHGDPPVEEEPTEPPSEDTGESK